MNATDTSAIQDAYFDFLDVKGFPCIAARAALAKNQIRCMVADHFGCPKDDAEILSFLYNFVDEYRVQKDLNNSAVIIFKTPEGTTEDVFDRMLWARLQAISDLDASRYAYDVRVDRDPGSPKFSFSLKGEAFYIIGLHSGSSRKARRFRYPTLVFNPHSQFEKLRKSNKYDPMRRAVRRRDLEFSGSVNPMLMDFGESSEVFQYSGIHYDKNWTCPFISNHEDA